MVKALAIYPRDETERGKRSEFIRQSNNPDDTQPIMQYNISNIAKGRASV